MNIISDLHLLKISAVYQHRKESEGGPVFYSCRYDSTIKYENRIIFKKM